MWPSVVSTIRQLQKELEEKGEAYLLLDLGDHMDRVNPITEASEGLANIALMNQVGYHYATMGNNEGITFAKEQLSTMYEQANFPILVNNITHLDGTFPHFFHPYALQTIGGKTIAFIGTTVAYEAFYQLLGWLAKDPFALVAEQIQLLRQQADLIVVLSHLGLPTDEKLAKEIAGIDIIIGSHTHHLLERGLLLDKTWIHQAGKLGHYVGQITVEWKKNQEMKFTSRCLPVSIDETDKQAEQVLINWQVKTKQVMAEEVVKIEQELPIDWFQESPAANLVAQAIRTWCKADISLINAGVILEDIPQGVMTKGDIHRLCPHPINPCLLPLTGKQIKSILIQSLNKELQQMKFKGLGFRGEVLGMLAVDGMEVICQQDQGIIQVNVQGQPIIDDLEYRVATLDMFTFGRFFSELFRPLHVYYFLPEFLRDVIVHYLQHNDLASVFVRRWKQLTEKERII